MMYRHMIHLVNGKSLFVENDQQQIQFSTFGNCVYIQVSNNNGKITQIPMSSILCIESEVQK